MRWLKILSVVALCICACGKKNKPTDAPAEPSTPSALSKPEVTALLRFWDATNGEHVYSYGDGEPKNWRQNTAFSEEQIVGYVAHKQLPDTSPLKRAYCRDRRHYFYLTKPAGATDIERIEDFHLFVWTKPGDGRVPVHACFLPDDKDGYFDQDLARVKGYADRASKRDGKQRKLVENFFYVYPTGPAPVTGPAPKSIPTAREPRAALTAEKGRKVGSIALSPDGKVVATATWDVVRLWDMDPPQERATLTGPKGMIHKVVFSPDGQTVAAVGYEGTVYLWNVQTQQQRTLKGTGREARGLAFAPDGKTIAVGGYVQREVPHPTFGKVITFFLHVVLQDVKTGAELGNWTGEKSSFGALAFLQGSNVLAVTEEGRASLRDPTTGQVKATVRHGSDVRELATTVDGALLATCAWDQTVKLWDGSGREVGALTGYPSKIGGVALTANGAVAVASGGNYSLDDTDARTDEVRVWDVSSKQLRAILAGQRGWMGSVAITPDGKTVVTGGGDGILRLWTVP
jgi:hypothetical protein